MPRSVLIHHRGCVRRHAWGLALMATLLWLPSCAAPRQCGTYRGATGKLGQHTLIVQRDGTVVDYYGTGDRGRWQAVCRDTIEGRLRLMGGGTQRRFYQLNRADHTFEWAYDLDGLRLRSDPHASAAPQQ